MKAYVLARVASKEEARDTMTIFAQVMANCGIPEMEGDAYFVEDKNSVEDATEVMLIAVKSMTETKCDMIVVQTIETFSPNRKVAADCANMFVKAGIPIFLICNGTLVAYKTDAKIEHAVVREM